MTSSLLKYERDKYRTKNNHVRRRDLDPVILRFSVSYKISRDGIAPPRGATNKRHTVLASQSLNSLALLPASPNLFFPVSGGRSSTPNSLRRDSPPSSGKSSGTSFFFLVHFHVRFHGSSLIFPTIRYSPRHVGSRIVMQKRATMRSMMRFNKTACRTTRSD